MLDSAASAPIWLFKWDVDKTLANPFNYSANPASFNDKARAGAGKQRRGSMRVKNTFLYLEDEDKDASGEEESDHASGTTSWQRRQRSCPPSLMIPESPINRSVLSELLDNITDLQHSAIAAEGLEPDPVCRGEMDDDDGQREDLNGVQEHVDNPAHLPVTTMMIRNISCRCTTKEVMVEIDERGFDGDYDFFYLPRDRRRKSNLGYAFINFRSSEVASEFQKKMQGHHFGSSRTQKICDVVLATIQGLENNLSHYLSHFQRTISCDRRPCFLQGEGGDGLTNPEDCADTPKNKKQRDPIADGDMVLPLLQDKTSQQRQRQQQRGQQKHQKKHQQPQQQQLRRQHQLPPSHQQQRHARRRQLPQHLLPTQQVQGGGNQQQQWGQRGNPQQWNQHQQPHHQERPLLHQRQHQQQWQQQLQLQQQQQGIRSKIEESDELLEKFQNLYDKVKVRRPNGMQLNPEAASFHPDPYLVKYQFGIRDGRQERE